MRRWISTLKLPARATFPEIGSFQPVCLGALNVILIGLPTRIPVLNWSDWRQCRVHSVCYSLRADEGIKIVVVAAGLSTSQP